MILSRGFAVACLALPAVGGCGPVPMIQVTTTIRPDGSCERSAWQPRGRLLPDEAFTPEWVGRWRKVEDVAAPPAFAKDNPNPGEGYFHAAGDFASPAEIPPHFRKIIQDRPELGAGDLVHEYHRRDFGLFVEHRWAETLANGVTRERFQEARDRLIDLGMPIFIQGFERVYGGDFDVSEAVAELDRRGRPLLRDLADAWYDSLVAAAGDPRALDAAMAREYPAAIERAGIDLRDPSGAVADGDEIDRRLRAHLADRVAATFRRKDGSATTAEDVRLVMEGLQSPRYGDAWRRYGNDRKSEIDAKLVPPLATMTGPYFFPGVFAPPGPRFAFDVHLPGLIVKDETNGDVDDAGGVSWRFDALRLFPTEFTMTAVGVDIDEAAQRRLLGRVAVADVPAALALRDLLDDDAELTDSLRAAAATGDRSLLDDAPDMAPARKARLAKLRDLLGPAR